MKKKTPFLVIEKNKELFSIQSNGNLVLEGKVIGKSKKLARLFTKQGQLWKAYLESQREFTALLEQK